MIPVYSRADTLLPSGAKKNGKIVSDYFAVLAIIFPLIWLLLCLSLENRHSHLHVNVAVYFAQLLRIFAQIMANFSALGMRPHSLHPHAVCLCNCRYTVYHTQNNNHLDQNIGIIWHKRSILVKDNTAEYNVSQEKKEAITKLSTMEL